MDLSPQGAEKISFLKSLGGNVSTVAPRQHKTTVVVQETKFEQKSQLQLQKDTEEKQRKIEHAIELRKLAEKVLT